MAKQVITVEITFNPVLVAGTGKRCNYFRNWLSSKIVDMASWVTNVEILTMGPIHWGPEDEPDNPVWRDKYLSSGGGGWPY